MITVVQDGALELLGAAVCSECCALLLPWRISTFQLPAACRLQPRARRQCVSVRLRPSGDRFTSRAVFLCVCAVVFSLFKRTIVRANLFSAI